MAGKGDIVEQALKLVMGGGDDAAKKAFANTRLKTPQGDPMRLYHMTPEDIFEFRASPENRSGPAVFLSPYSDYQPAYHQSAETDPSGELTERFKEGANVMPVYADVRNPLVLDHPRKVREAAAKYQGGDRNFPRIVTPEAKAAMEADGYDAIIFGGDNPIPYGDRPMDARLGHQEARDEEFIIFDPRKIKSATANRGTYDTSDPDITKALGGAIDDEDIDTALRLARAMGGRTGYAEAGSVPVMMEDAKGNKYDAQGNIIPPTSPTGASYISDPTLERKGMMDEGEPVNYETEVKPFIDVATSPMNWAVESPNSYSGFPLGIGTVQTEGPSLLDTMKIATQLAASGQPTEDRGEYNWGQSREKAIRRFVGAPEGGEEAPYRGPFSYNPSDTANFVNTLVGFSPVGWGELFHDIPYEAGRTGDYGTAAYEGGINAAFSAPGIAALGLAGRAAINALRRNPKLAAGLIGSTAFVDPNEAEAGPERWFSKAMEVARALPMEKMTGQQALAMLRKGVSPEEIKWTGADAFLPQQKQITKQDLVDYLAKNRVQTQDVVFGGSKPVRRDNVVPSKTAIAPYKERWDELVAQNRALNEIMLLPPSERDADIDDLLAQRNDIQYEMDQIHDKAVDATIEEMGGLGRPLQFGPGSQYGEKYVTRGGEDYRETLITLPPQEKVLKEWPVVGGDGITHGRYMSKEAAEKAAERIAGGTVLDPIETKIIAGYRGKHWSEPNVASHIRTQILDVTPPGANRPYKAFNVDEAQSDWAKAGREKGFFDETRHNAEVQRLKAEVEEAEKAAKPYTDIGKDAPRDVIQRWTDAMHALRSIEGKKTDMPPVAPYVTGTQGWTDLSIKKALDQAMDAGADYFTYTPGEAQAKRYSLRNEVQGLAYDPEEKTLSFYPKDGRGWQDVPDAVPREDLKKYVGEEAAKKLLAQEPNALSGNHILEGIDLEFGGEGMIDYYDNIYKKRVEKVVKDATGKKVQWEVIPVQTADGPREQLGFRLTDDMKEARFSDFNKGGRVTNKANYADSPNVSRALALTRD